MAKTISLPGKKRTLPARRSTKKRASAHKPRAARPRRVNGKTEVTPALLQEMTRRLVAEFHPEQIILFGSRAWGKPTSSSDVDLMVIVAKSEESHSRRILRAYEALGDLIVPTDIFVKTRDEFDLFAQVPASLENAIVRKGRVLYARRKAQARANLVDPGTA